MATAALEQLWTFKDAAADLKSTPATIRGLVKARKLQTFKVPRSPNARGLKHDAMIILASALGREFA